MKTTKLSTCGSTFIDKLLHYETQKIVDIKNKKVGLLFRFIQSIILAYVIGYVIVHKKGYQESDIAISTVSTKLKGTTAINFTHLSKLYNGVQVFDPADYVIPPQETDGFFVMTNMVLTPLQAQGKCPEDPKFKHNWCTTDKDCQPPMEMVKGGNGVRTGVCVHSDSNPPRKVCEIQGWCPTEEDVLPMPGRNLSKTIPLLHAAKDFTVLIKNQITFPKFRVQRRNIMGYKSGDSLKHCVYSAANTRCPIFVLGDILRFSGYDFTDVAFKGGIIGIHIQWDCNLDYHEDYCIPTYNFTRLDDPDTPISPGYNFRYSNYFVIDNKRYRTLTKAYGIKFQVLVNGKAGKFSPVPLFLNLGAGLALLGLAKVWCDFIVLTFLEKRKLYRERKFDRVDDTHSEDVSEEEEQLAEEEQYEEKKHREKENIYEDSLFSRHNGGGP